MIKNNNLIAIHIDRSHTLNIWDISSKKTSVLGRLELISAAHDRTANPVAGAVNVCEKKKTVRFLHSK